MYKRQEKEYLLVDGYNIIYAWEDLKELADANLHAAQTKLMDIPVSYTHLDVYKRQHGMCVFSTGERAGYPMFYRNAEKKLAREQRKLSRCEKGCLLYTSRCV